MFIRKIFSLFILCFFICIIPRQFLLGSPKQSQTNSPKVLLFSAIDTDYLADTLSDWGENIGINGFMLAYVADWWTPKKQIFKDIEVLTKINKEGAAYGIDSNFIKVAIGYRELPNWTDDKAWAVVLNNFRNIADLIKQSGTKGIALDTEPYKASLFDTKAERFKSMNRDILKAKIYQRGKEIMQSLTGVFPDIEVIILPEGAFYWFNPGEGTMPYAYELWIDFFNGMASVKNNKGIVVAGECTYSNTRVDSITWLYNTINKTMKQHVEDPVFWKERCSVALGMWPLGKSYSDKSARYSPVKFKEQFLQTTALSPKYVWIYACGAPWWQMKKAEVKKYTANGRWIWEKKNQALPMDPAIKEYYAVVKQNKIRLNGK
ncbi:MAG: hypothetical protein K8F34_03010 [Candidatus Kuenenia stuttgartiensis]|uniref:Uncharacterized protein n=1 Tax=Kuenenia stuttgartiensis TaxID=174633 RepID=A0A2C9CCI2_KUEST|nr:hypothetical protein [Candidatus Kuenenia stuttgartiensis]MBZ0190647.1 hypothetical protein [Candidatus Kuenenia stuttgartiensis]SOH03400.1 hypothetical protein KSMBR1_0889 [Candidatus Kuenenia stuttgartiensis]